MIPSHYKITLKKSKMKKLVFAAQVFGLIPMLPVVVILEMNHGTGRSSEKTLLPVLNSKQK